MMKLHPRLLALAAATLIAMTAGDATSQAPPAGATAVPVDHAPELDAAIRAAVNDHALRGAQIGIAIYDIETGHYLAVSNEHAPLNPASNAKLFTAAAALATLHGNHRYETTLSGNVKKDGVVGPLVLRGHGDPSLSTAHLWEMVEELRTYGVRHIDGDILVDQLFFDDQTTPPAFEQQPNEWSYFRAPVSAVALNENCVTLTVRPNAGGAGGRAFAEFDPPGFVDIDGAVRTGDSGADNVVLALSPVGPRLTAKLSGTIAEDSRLVRYTKRVEDPTLLAGYALKALLERADIKVSGDVKAGGAANKSKTLARHVSPPLSELLYSLGKQSDNFYAEMIFKTLGGEANGRPAKSEGGAAQVMRWLDRVGANDAGTVIKNGSGLFDANRVTASSVVQLLRAVWKDPEIAPEFLAQLSIGGVDGTLHKRFRGENTRRLVRAKTGTLDDTIALSGYVLSESGKGPIAFSLLFNHVGGHQDSARNATDKLVELIARRLNSAH